MIERHMPIIKVVVVDRGEWTQSIGNVQYCAKEMQTNSNEFPGFSKTFRLKRYFEEISPHFRDTYCFDPRAFSSDNSHCSMIHREFSS